MNKPCHYCGHDRPPRRVKLFGGLWDGVEVEGITHGVCVMMGELYIYAGGEDKDRLDHARSVLRKLPREQREAEKRIVTEWVQKPSLLPWPETIPPWRVMAWIEVERYDPTI